MKDELFNELLDSIKEGAEITKNLKRPSRSFSFKNINVPAIRKKYGLPQSKFAQLLGISVGTLKNWEQGRRKPTGSARVLLRIAERHPESLLETDKHHISGEK
jgi:putative transcriptional regulator